MIGLVATLAHAAPCIAMTRPDTLTTDCATRSGASRGERKLDLWLRHSLSEAHDEVLSERLPQAWLSMIDRSLPQG